VYTYFLATLSLRLQMCAAQGGCWGGCIILQQCLVEDFLH
jgi:hypothetical protein